MNESPPPTIEIPLEDQRFAVSLGLQTMILVSDVMVVGREPWGDIPIEGRIESKHAVIAYNAGIYRLWPLWNERGLPYEVFVNHSQRHDPCTLSSRDMICFGRGDCEWEFRQPVTGSRTAVLEKSARTVPVIRGCNGERMERAVLLQDFCRIGSGPEVHIKVDRFPGTVIVSRASGKLTLSCEEAEMTATIQRDANDQPVIDVEVRPIRGTEDFSSEMLKLWRNTTPNRTFRIGILKPGSRH